MIMIGAPKPNVKSMNDMCNRVKEGESFIIYSSNEPLFQIVPIKYYFDYKF